MRIIATAGHVDHGKSSLVQALTGTDPDRWEEEKRRGLTIDLGFAFTQIAEKQIGFIDVPGHVRFLRNMLAGIGGIDACMFVVAANEGWKPQTEEHLRILDALGITRGVIVLTKTDLVDAKAVDQLKHRLMHMNPRAPITGITQANPGVVTSTAHGYSNGNTVVISGVVGMTQVNGKRFKVANVATNTFELQDIDFGLGVIDWSVDQ